MKKYLFITVLALIAMLFVGQSAMAQSTDCYHESSVSSQADSFTTGYSILFDTDGTSVTVTAEMFDTDKASGLGAYLWDYTNGFAEVSMTSLGDNKFSYTLTGLTDGSTITCAVKFAYTPSDINTSGMTVTSSYTYVVGTICGDLETVAPVMTTATLVTGSETYQGAQIAVAATDVDDDAVATTVTKFKVMNGETAVGTFTAENGVITVTGLDAETAYTVTVYAVDNSGNVSESGVNVTFTTTERTDAPTVSANPPTHDAANVVSVYSDTYSQGVTGFSNPTWGILANYTTIGTDNLFSIDFSTGNQFAFTFTSIDLSAMEYLYFDCWVETAQQLNVAILTYTNGDSREKTVDLAAGWNQVSIPLTYYTENDGVLLTEIWGVKLYTTTNAAVAGLLPYVDNIIFYKAVVTDNNAPTMSTATFESATYSTATISVTSTDTEEAECNYYVMNGDDEVGTFTATDGQITVTGLTAETEYTLKIYAKDLGLNVSTNYATVTFTTTERTDLPKVSATPLNKAAANVYSFFSDAYETSATSLDLNPNWGEQPSYYTYYQLEVETGDFVAVYPGMTYQGIDFDAVNALTYDYVHVDIWMEEDATINFYPICQTDVYSLPLTIVGGQWNSFNLSVDDFTNLGLEMALMTQFKIDNGLGADVFMDNLYLWREPIEDNDAPTGLTVTVDESATTYKSLTLNLYAEDESGTVSYDITYGEGLTATAAGKSGETTTTTISGLDAETAYTFIVEAYDVNDNRTEAVSSTPAFTAVHPAAPLASAPIPSHPKDNVMSVYSDTYEQKMGYTVANWGWETTSIESYAIGDDNIMMLADYNYIGFEFTETHDLSSYPNLHFDVWAEEMTSITVTPISIATYGDDEVSTTYQSLQTVEFTEGEWNSVDIILSEFDGVDFENIKQMKFDGGSGSDIVYLDNIYYYKKSSTTVVGVENTTVSTSVVYPNPATDFMIVEAESTIELVTVYNIMGQAVSSTVGGAQSATISVAGLSVGNYIVRVQTADGSVSMHKLIKQ